MIMKQLFISIVLIGMVLGPAILEAYMHRINPVPKMKDRSEEKFFWRTIRKTRTIYEFEKR